MSNPEASCGNYPFFHEEGHGTGTCRYNAPVVVTMGGVPFPVMNADDHCGRHPMFFVEVGSPQTDPQYMGKKRKMTQTQTQTMGDA